MQKSYSFDMLHAEQEEYIKKMKGIPHYLYLSEHRNILMLKILLTFLISIIFIWAIYSFEISSKYFFILIPSTLWLLINQIYTWNAFVLFKNKELMCMKEMWMFPWSGTYTESYAINLRCQQIYWKVMNYFMKLITVLGWVIGLFIWITAFQFGFILIKIITKFDGLELLNTFFYENWFWAFLRIFLIIFSTYYILFTSKDEREITHPKWVRTINPNLFTNARDNRSIIRWIYIILSWINIIWLSIFISTYFK